MAATRSSKSSTADTGDKRSAPAAKSGGASKKAKKEDGKLEVGKDGQVGLKEASDHQDGEEQVGVDDGSKEANIHQNEPSEPKSQPDLDQTKEEVKEGADHEKKKEHGGSDGRPEEETKDDEKVDTKDEKPKPGEDMEQTREEMKEEEGKKAEKGEDEVDGNALQGTKEELDEPKHGTLESGHIYFLYRPKIDHGDDVGSIDDISKFHMVLIPKSAPHDKGHFHRIIEIGKKKMPDPGAKNQVIWGLVSGVGEDKAAFKDSFGAYSYETKTRGTRHQEAARPAARGHYILHSPRDPLADDPSKNRQRDFKCILAYEITTPTSDDFGEVQKELGLAIKDAVALQVKDPEVQSGNNPRAASIPREKRAQYPENLMEIFRGRRFIPANPVSFLSYAGAEILVVSSPHSLEESLGKDGEKVEHDLDEDAKAEKEGVDGALKELGLSKGDFEIEALEGEWA